MEVSARAAELNEALLSPTAPSRWRTLRLIMVVGGVSIGTSFQFGFGTGALNNLEDVAPAALAAAGGPLVLWQWSLIVSGFSIGGLLGSIAVSCLTMRYSRKTVLLLCNIFVFASSGLLMTGTAWPVLLLGRVCIGLVAGIGSAVVPMYLAEISPTSARSAVGTAHQLLGDATSWRYAFVVPVCCSLVQLVILPFCPESPAYVYRTVGSHAALRKLEELHTPGSIGGHIDALRDEASMLGGPAESGFTFSELLSARKLRRQLLIGIVIQLSMQFSGIDAIFYYSTIALRRAGMSNPQLATTSLGALNVGLTLVAISLMNRLGRRTLLLTAWGGMALSYVVLTCSLALAETDESGTMHYVVLLAMAGVVSSFAIGPGCIGWFVVAEIFPPYAIDAAMSMGVTLNWLANWVVAFSFPLLHARLGPYTFALFAVTTSGFGLFTWWVVPETHLRSTSELQAEIKRRCDGCAGCLGAL